ncbi:hypothetical protein [Segniliparus rugosus]|uniref:Uncharacterized protein n=1 Tax=Segniliparus rugosus (strain ATCC BAA-974 / DSM 45345 / CCUG 50838 / CIP 108380 / JCM 13579 / CDC 945) TaxID=679197 RepID=U1N5E6_SEGRC|nr:hypothetical protein [Segniliparus rugosus]ERG69369.1 hypothetical protein HMPREF9336_04065 [Segniliparus rugosus ATCC BAA-974]
MRRLQRLGKGKSADSDVRLASQRVSHAPRQRRVLLDLILPAPVLVMDPAGFGPWAWHTTGAGAAQSMPTGATRGTAAAGEGSGVSLGSAKAVTIQRFSPLPIKATYRLDQFDWKSAGIALSTAACG